MSPVAPDEFALPEIGHDERLDQLRGTPFRLIQKIDGTAYAVDSVLLARFVTLPATGRVIDLGTGNGILPLLIKARRPSLDVIGVELQTELVDLARRNLALNPTIAGVTIEPADIRELPALMLPESCDVVVTNPPYYPRGEGRLPENMPRALSRHELAGTLADFIGSAAWLLTYGGVIAIVLPAKRYFEADQLLRAQQFGVRRLRFVMPKPGERAILVLIEAERFFNGRHQPLPDLIMRDERGHFTPEMNAIYDGK